MLKIIEIMQLQSAFGYRTCAIRLPEPFDYRTKCPVTEWSVTEWSVTEWAVTEWSVTEWSVTEWSDHSVTGQVNVR